MKKLISLALAAVLALGILSGCGKKADAAIQIAVPNDTTNEARALLLLEANGIIKLKDGAVHHRHQERHRRESPQR